MNLSGRERVLVIKPSSLGDIVHTLPAVSALQRSFPDLSIDWLVNTEWSPLLEGAPFLHRHVPFPRREFRGLGGLLRARKWGKTVLGEVGYDLALDFQGLLRSALLARLSGAPVRLGFSNAREGAHVLYGNAICVQNWKEKHAVDRNRELVEFLGVETDPVEFPLPAGSPIDVPPPFSGPALLLHPFSRGAGKSLSVTEVHELCELVSPHPVWLVGVAGEEATHSWPNNTWNLLNRTSIAELIFLLRRASWIASVDSGPMHLAAAISDRVLSIHTWSNPCMVGPWPRDAWIWRESEIVQVRDLTPDRFPEHRQLRKHYEGQDRILDEPSIATLAEFLNTRITE